MTQKDKSLLVIGQFSLFFGIIGFLVNTFVLGVNLVFTFIIGVLLGLALVLNLKVLYSNKN